MKVKIDWDEWYPVFHVDPRDGRRDVDVPQETLDRWERIAAEFDAAQDEMRKAAGYGTEGN